MAIHKNVDSDFDVNSLAKLITVIAVLEKLQPGAIRYLVETAAILADDWTITRSVNNVEAAKRTFTEFREWLNKKDDIPLNDQNDQPSDDIPGGYTQI